MNSAIAQLWVETKNIFPVTQMLNTHTTNEKLWKHQIKLNVFSFGLQNKHEVAIKVFSQSVLLPNATWLVANVAWRLLTLGCIKRCTTIVRNLACVFYRICSPWSPTWPVLLTLWGWSCVCVCVFCFLLPQRFCEKVPQICAARCVCSSYEKIHFFVDFAILLLGEYKNKFHWRHSPKDRQTEKRAHLVLQQICISC